MPIKPRTKSVSNPAALTSADLKVILEMVNTVKFGSITVIIQDGRVIQVDRNEKLRLR